MRIAIFTSSFPVLSETFIINQITGLIKLDVEVDIITNEVVTLDVMHSAVEEYSLLERIKCVGLNHRKSKFNRLMLTIVNALALISKGKLTSLLDILFDKYLSREQKFNLIFMLIEKKNETIKYDNVICHFGTNGYYVCKMRELGLIAGPISTVFHGVEISHYELIKKHLKQYKQLFLKGDLMLPISELWEEQLIKWGCVASKVKVHRMGVDVKTFKLKPICSPFSSP
jgi:colanic acid/amylovoran biosynthesis glycosyltransferase